MRKKTAAILTGPDTHLDHLGVLAHLMNMPLIVHDKKTFSSAQFFYPQVQTIYKTLHECDMHFLAHTFDALFQSAKCFALELSSSIELLYKKNMRFIYCPHGHSDKGHSAKTFAPQDISLVYGDHMLDLLQSTGAISSIKATIVTGNYRLSFYQKYRSFYDNLAKNLITKHFTNNPSKKMALYAPSWEDGENPTSFFSALDRLIEELHHDFHLIIKPHPLLESFHPERTWATIKKHESNSSVLFLHNFPCIYPLLALCDLYIGDYSSIGYDFLWFNKPLYFSLTKESPSFMLHKAGLLLPIQGSISNYIKTSWTENAEGKKEEREKLYSYVFGKEKDWDALREEIYAAL